MSTKYPTAIALLSIIMYAAFLGSTFLAAGTWRLPFFWAVFMAQLVISLIGLKFIDPDLISERMHPRGKDSDPLARFILSGLFLATFWIAGADVGRWHISHIPVSMQVVAFLIQSLGWVGFVWSMAANKYFSLAIRLQPDRQQSVITEGPYKWIRHPGYGIGSLAFFVLGIALGSWLAEIPALLMVVDLIYRTLLEERLLRSGLPGYTEYAEKVRYRWLPGIW